MIPFKTEETPEVSDTIDKELLTKEVKKAWPRSDPLRMSNNVKLSSGILKGLGVSLCVN